MCLAVPGQIIKLNQKRATINIMGVTREISIELLDYVEVGDYVIVHAGCAISKLDEESARETIALFRELGEVSRHE